MAKTRGVEAKLARLRVLRHETESPELNAELGRALEDRSNPVAAAAAEIVGERFITAVAANLVAAFDRFMADDSDKLCRAKTAIVEALNKLEHDAEAVFRRGVVHVQPEAAWGPPVDSAVHLRAACAFGLARIGVRDLLDILVDRLVEKDHVVRRAVIQALAASGKAAAVPLLRLKARIGDEEPSVTGECLSALMSVAPIESLPLVTAFLHSASEELQEGAAFALGESRRPEALQALIDHWPRAHGRSLQEALLLAISMTRLPAGIDFLLNVLADESGDVAADALFALRIHRHNAAIKQRVAAAVAERGDTELQANFQKKFDDV